MIEMDGYYILDVIEQSINGNCRFRYIFIFICDYRLDRCFKILFLDKISSIVIIQEFIKNVILWFLFIELEIFVVGFIICDLISFLNNLSAY